MNAKHILAESSRKPPRINTYRTPPPQLPYNQHFQDLPEVLILHDLNSLGINTSSTSARNPNHFNTSRKQGRGRIGLKNRFNFVLSAPMRRPLRLCYCLSFARPESVFPGGLRNHEVVL
jgi:hypothetical protein